MKTTFNLITEPWIKVKYDTNSNKLVSLKTLFTDAKHIKHLAGDTKMQDFSILRLLLAIETTVYNQSSNNFETWEDLYKNQDFSDVLHYLDKHFNEFDFLGDKPFYQVNRETYAKYAKISEKTGTLLIKQMNRSINESDSSLNTTSFTSNLNKNKIDLPSLVRWLITYQNVTGVTDKTKVNKKSSIDSGLLAQIRPIYLNGKTLAETLVLNLILNSNTKSKPVWEAKSYSETRSHDYYPDNIPELYTTLSRMIYIEYKNDQPLIHVAGYPKLDLINQFVEPMTTWKFVKEKNKVPINGFQPESFNIKSEKYQHALWRSFGLFVNENQKEDRLPGIIQWIHTLEEHEILPIDFELPLATVASVNNGGATSQTPILEVSDQLKLNLNLAFENRLTLNDLVSNLQQVGYWLGTFGSNIDKLYGTNLKKQIVRLYYESLDMEFNNWFENLTDDNFNPDIWTDKIIKRSDQLMFNTMMNLQFKQDLQGNSIFDYKNIAMSKIRKIMKGE